MDLPRPATVDMLRRLVAFDTTSRESNLALIHWVRDYLAEHGIGSLLVHDEAGREGAEIVSLAKRATGRNAAGKVAFGCEAGLYDAAGIPTVICGPGHVDQAHKPDEFVSLAQLAECERFLRRIAAETAAVAL